MIMIIKSLTLLYFIISFQTAIAQPSSTLIVEASQVFSSFRFVDGRGDIDNTYDIRLCGAYYIGYQYSWGPGYIVGASVGLCNAGALKVYGSDNYTWELQYERVKLDLGYIYQKMWLKPYVLVSPYYGYLAKASENTGLVNYDIKKSNSIRTSDFGLIPTVGVRIPLSRVFQCYAAANYNLGLLNIETSPGQRLYNRGFSLSLGIAVKLPDAAELSRHKTAVEN